MGNRKEYLQEYYQAHKEKLKRRAYAWRKTEKGKLYCKGYYKNHREQCNLNGRNSHNKLKQRVLTHYGNGEIACVKCRESRMACLSIDHIDGGGLKHRIGLGVKGGVSFYHWLEKNSYPIGYQTLCMNCQFVKREETTN